MQTKPTDTIPLNLPENVRKYLKKYSAGNWKAETDPRASFNNIAVIPALKEYQNVISLISSLAKCEPEHFKNTLFLFVINNTLSASEEVKNDNRKTLLLLRNIIHNSDKQDPLAAAVVSSGLNIGVVDASGGEMALPEKDGGVGLARKIGMDIALSLFNYKNSRKNILICLDADCTVSGSYLTEIVNSFNRNKYNAAYVRFEHPLPAEEENKLAIISYEIFLRYYVLGLIYARSGYAIHTIGSTMICDYESYIKVEGMNKKKAAEDFYFMEKLCKNFIINKIENAKIYPSARGSWRVPFGTGQRVNRFLAGTQDEYLLYSPGSFDVLKEWLGIFNAPRILPAEEYLKEARNIHPSLASFLAENNFTETWNKIESGCKSEAQLARQKHFWFDGFRTLKLIHYLRDNGFPQIEMFSAAETLLGKFGKETELAITEDYRNCIDKQLVYLNRLREIA